MTALNDMAQDTKAKVNGQYKQGSSDQYRDQLKDHVKEAADTVSDKAKSMTSGAAKMASDLAKNYGVEEKFESAQEMVSGATSAVRRFGKDSEQYLKDHPYRALAAGAVLGLAAATWFRRNR
jgi:ElaB/YqjD/DUF883 family membrane-anchored ribosome-binding protein